MCIIIFYYYKCFYNFYFTYLYINYYHDTNYYHEKTFGFQHIFNALLAHIFLQLILMDTIN